MASTKDKILKKIRSLWKQAEQLQKQWAAQSETKPAKKRKAKPKAKAKAKVKAKRRRSSK